MGDTLAFRWNVASGGHEHPFTPEALQALWEHSGGVPREATILADNALLLGFFGKLLAALLAAGLFDHGLAGFGGDAPAELDVDAGGRVPLSIGLTAGAAFVSVVHG